MSVALTLVSSADNTYGHSSWIERKYIQQKKRMIEKKKKREKGRGEKGENNGKKSVRVETKRWSRCE